MQREGDWTGCDSPVQQEQGCRGWKDIGQDTSSGGMAPGAKG